MGSKICHEIDDHLPFASLPSSILEGNKRFRCLLDKHIARYSGVSTKLEKSLIVSEIIDEVRSNGGSFVRFDRRHEKWFEVGDQLAREKAGQALRAKLRKAKAAEKTKTKSTDSKHLKKVPSMDFASGEPGQEYRIVPLREEPASYKHTGSSGNHFRSNNHNEYAGSPLPLHYFGEGTVPPAATCEASERHHGGLLLDERSSIAFVAGDPSALGTAYGSSLQQRTDAHAGTGADTDGEADVIQALELKRGSSAWTTEPLSLEDEITEDLSPLFPLFKDAQHGYGREDHRDQT